MSESVNFNFSDIKTFGCVLLTEEIPHLYIMDKGMILEGIPFANDDDLYLTLEENELILVGVDVKDEDGECDIDVRDIDDENYDELVYTVIPLKFHTLKTHGLMMEDVMDMGFFDMMIDELIKGYVTNLNMN